MIIITQKYDKISVFTAHISNDECFKFQQFKGLFFSSNFQAHNRCRLPNLKLVSAINNPSACVPVCDKTR